MTLRLPVKRYYTIAEISSALKVSALTIEHWRDLFCLTDIPGTNRKSNRKVFRHHEFVLLHQIKDLLQNEGFQVGELKRKFYGQTLLAPHQIRDELVNIRDTLKKS